MKMSGDRDQEFDGTRFLDSSLAYIPGYVFSYGFLFCYNKVASILIFYLSSLLSTYISAYDISHVPLSGVLILLCFLASLSIFF